jgi:hypothetical protein
MATTVQNAFEEFNKDVVNLDSDRTKKARASRDWLLGKLSGFDQKEGLYFPFEYNDKHIKFGSFARNTKIRELDDIDLMFCLKADNAYYSHSCGIYYIHTENAGERLKKLSSDNILNSTKVINKFVSALSNVEHYSSADIHKRGEAAILTLTSYEWNFDIVPCFYTVEGFYLIPDGKGNWKATNPIIDQELITNVNQRYNGLALQLIRTLKYWNRHNSTNTIGSYLFEQIVINFVKQKTELSQWIDFDIRDFFSYLSNNIFSPVYDPKNIQGNINDLNFQEQHSISEKAEWAFNKAKEAISAETNEKNQEKAINKWREIFGNKFPKYE